MPLGWVQFGDAIERVGRQLAALYWNEWTLVQLGLVLIAFLLSRPIGTFLAQRLEARARQIKGNASLLRLIVALMRRLKLAAMVALLFVFRLALIAASAPDALLAIVLMLTGAWLGLSVMMRLIRNRSLARFFAFAGWLYVAVLVLNIAGPVGQALDVMAFNIGEVRFSALLVLRATLVTAGVIWLAIFVSQLIEARLERSEDVSPSGKVLFAKLVRIGLVLVAGGFALTATGIDLTALTVVSGAVGVGVGFGLQKVVSNFISGIIILLDRSIKPGDTIEVGETFGWIVELRARFVSVSTRDGRKYLIPNEDFITQRVINWSYSDQFVRIDVDFGVSYDSDPHQVAALAIAAATGVRRVNDYRAPVCWLTKFGASSLDFKLRFWINDPKNGLTNVRGEVMLALWDAFKAAGVQIPYPQQDVHFRTPLDVRVDSKQEPPPADPSSDP